MKRMLTILEAPSERMDQARALFREYQQTPGVAECVAGFEQEVDGLPGRYAPPGGVLLLALHDGAPAGCVGVRPVEPGVCEMKRLYVKPEYRGQSVGEALTRAAMNRAKSLGYRSMRLDTLPSMTSAIGLYQGLGFRKIACYYEGAPPDAYFYEIDLIAANR